MIMKKVLIISTPFFGYPNSIARAFEKLGYECRIDAYDLPVHPFKGWNKWAHKFCSDKEAFETRNYALYNDYIKPVFDSYKPDIVYIYDGSILFDETLDYFRAGGASAGMANAAGSEVSSAHPAKIIIWMYDSVQNPRFARCRSHIDHCDAFFCFEQKDVEMYATEGRKAFFMPLACDTAVYHPIEPAPEKDIDIFFAGAIYSSIRRRRILEEVADRYGAKGLDLKFYGRYKPFEKDPLGCIFRGRRDVFTNRNIQPQVVNGMLNRSKIAFNVHHEQTITGANQRVFEVCGSGCYQICDANEFLEKLFPNGEVGLYHSDEEMFALIDNALSHDMSRQAAEARQIILKGHTFEARVEEMLSHI